MKRFFKHLQGFGLFTSFSLYISYKIKFLKSFTFNYRGNNITLRPGKSDYAILNQVFVDNQYDCFEFINKPEIIIDGGANIGLSVLYFKLRFPDVKIFCLEPEYENALLLKKNLSKFKEIYVIQKGLWNISQNVFLNRGGCSADYFVTDVPTTTTISKIPCVSISDLIGEYDIKFVDILKLDIEGAEKNILSSNTEWLDKVGCLMIETHDRMIEGTGRALFDVLQDYNFHLEVQGETMKFFSLTKRDIKTN
jgi:FkbM family methyltransferase